MSAAIAALRNRATTGLLSAAAANNQDGFNWFAGHLAALRMLDNGAGLKLASKDARGESGAYEPPGMFKAAWAALPVDIECLSLPEVRELIVAHGVEISTHPVADGQVDAVHQLKDCEAPAAGLDDKEAAALVDGNDGSGAAAHTPSFDRAIVGREGGAT